MGNPIHQIFFLLLFALEIFIKSYLIPMLHFSLIFSLRTYNILVSMFKSLLNLSFVEIPDREYKVMSVGFSLFNIYLVVLSLFIALHWFHLVFISNMIIFLKPVYILWWLNSISLQFFFFLSVTYNYYKTCYLKLWYYQIHIWFSFLI